MGQAEPEGRLRQLAGERPRVGDRHGKTPSEVPVRPVHQGCPGTLFGALGHDFPVAPSSGAFPARRAGSGAAVHLPGGTRIAALASWALTTQCRLASGM